MKRKDPVPDQRSEQNLLKRVKKTPKIGEKLFLLTVKKKHTKYIQQTHDISVTDTGFLKEEIVSSSLESEVIKPIRIIKTLRIKKKISERIYQAKF